MSFSLGWWSKRSRAGPGFREISNLFHFSFFFGFLFFNYFFSFFYIHFQSTTAANAFGKYLPREAIMGTKNSRKVLVTLPEGLQ